MINNPFKPITSARKMAMGGIATALISMLLWLTSMFVFNRLVILLVCTMLIAIVVIEIDRKTAWLVFAVSGMIGLMIVANKMLMIYYIVLFGNYAMIKQRIESLSGKKWAYSLKIMYFNGALIALLVSLQLLTNVSVEKMIDFNAMIAKITDIRLSNTVIIAIIIVVYQFAWVIGDRVLTMVITLYYQRFYKNRF
jgi:hypothetical protein